MVPRRQSPPSGATCVRNTATGTRAGIAGEYSPFTGHPPINHIQMKTIEHVIYKHNVASSYFSSAGHIYRGIVLINIRQVDDKQ